MSLVTIMKDGYKLGLFQSGQFVFYRQQEGREERLPSGLIYSIPDYVPYIASNFNKNVIPKAVFDELSGVLVKYCKEKYWDKRIIK